MLAVLVVVAVVCVVATADVTVHRSAHVVRIVNPHMQFRIGAQFLAVDGSQCEDLTQLWCVNVTATNVEISNSSSAHPWVQFVQAMVDPHSCAFALQRNIPETQSDCWVKFADEQQVQTKQRPPAKYMVTDIIQIAKRMSTQVVSIHGHLFFNFVRNKHFLSHPLELKQQANTTTTTTTTTTNAAPSTKSRNRMRRAHVDQFGSTSTVFLQAGDDRDDVPEVYEGMELLDSPSPVAAKDETSGAELNSPDAQDSNSENDDSEQENPAIPSVGEMRSKYKDLFPDFVLENPLAQDSDQFLQSLPKRTGMHDFKLSQNAKSAHLAAGAKIFAADVSKRAFTILLEEKSSIQTRGQSTFLLMDIVKLFAAPFVAVLYTPVGQPLSRGMGGGGKMPISGATGLAMGVMMFFVIAFPLGLILGILVANMLTEALTYTITWQTTAATNRRIPKQIADGIVSKLNDYIFNAAAPTMRDIIKNLLIDVLSDTISTSLHHTLIKSVSERLSSTLTPATMHYYYCVYCYYYGDYCDICFKVSDYDILHKMWTVGQTGEQWTFDGP